MYGSAPVRSGSPWQEEQVSTRTSTTPSTWVATLAWTTVYPLWQLPQIGVLRVRRRGRRPVAGGAGLLGAVDRRPHRGGGLAARQGRAAAVAVGRGAGRRPGVPHGGGALVREGPELHLAGGRVGGVADVARNRVALAAGDRLRDGGGSGGSGGRRPRRGWSPNAPGCRAGEPRSRRAYRGRPCRRLPTRRPGRSCGAPGSWPGCPTRCCRRSRCGRRCRFVSWTCGTAGGSPWQKPQLLSQSGKPAAAWHASQEGALASPL